MQFRIGVATGQAEGVALKMRPFEPAVKTLVLPPTQAAPALATAEVRDDDASPRVSPEVLETRQKGPSMGQGRPSPTALERELNDLARGADARRFGDRVYERARQILEEAYESASELRLEALSRIREQMSASERGGNDLRTRATEESATLRAQAQTEAQLALQRAQREADGIVANARATAQRIAEGARAEADAIQSRAQRESAEVHEAASRALADARARLAETERIENEFETAAREIARFLGITVEQDRRLFRGLARGKK